MVWRFGQRHVSMQQVWLMLQEKHSDIALSVEVELAHGRRLPVQFEHDGTFTLFGSTTWLSHLVWTQLKKKHEYWQYWNVKCITRFMPMLSLWQSHKLHLAARPKTVRPWDFFSGCCLCQANLHQASHYWTGIFSDKHATVIECVYFCQRSTPRGYANRSPHSLVLF